MICHIIHHGKGFRVNCWFLSLQRNDVLILIMHFLLLPTRLVLLLFCVQGQYSPSYLCCPETYTWHLLSDCGPKLDVSKYSRFAAPNVGTLYLLVIFFTHCCGIYCRLLFDWCNFYSTLGRIHNGLGRLIECDIYRPCALASAQPTEFADRLAVTKFTFSLSVTHTVSFLHLLNVDWAGSSPFRGRCSIPLL